MTRITWNGPALGAQAAPLDPPTWAGSTMPEDGGIVHERVATIHPVIRQWTGLGWSLVPTDVSVEATDIHTETGWFRPHPTIRLEGGSYTLDGLHQLKDAINQLLALVEDPTGKPTPPGPTLISLNGSSSQDGCASADETSEQH